MIVTQSSFKKVIQSLQLELTPGLDCETTGTSEDDQLFSVIITDSVQSYYFNFKKYVETGFDDNSYLPREWIVEFQSLFDKPNRTWFIHNAKFDARMLAKEGIDIKGKLHCTYAIERVIQNNYFGGDAYKLSGCAARRGLEKSEAVSEYIQKNKLYTKIKVPGKKKLVEKPHFDQVPFHIIAPYGEKDGHLHRAIGLDQINAIATLESSRPEGHPSYYPVYNNELKLTKTCFKMERLGIKINKPFVEAALKHELSEIAKYEAEFLKLTGTEFDDSRTVLKKVFDVLGEKYPLTEKGNASFAAEVLEEMETPAAAVINRIRHHYKRAGTYYSSFLYYADKNDIVHADINQAGTEPGRMSYRDPNLQNVPKEEAPDPIKEPEEYTEWLKIPYHVRESFVPREGKFFYDVDYEQMEYRLMLDYAGEMGVIARVMDGEDLHQAMADLVGISRKHAKTLNFAVLYGAGVTKIAKMLGITLKEAKYLKDLYFAKLPRVEKFINDVRSAGKARGYIFNWAGRRQHIAMREWAYVLPNHCIQGGCADVVKFAMNQIDDYIEKNKMQSKMLMQVHDELLFEFVESEKDEIHEIQKIMESIYVGSTGIKLTTSAAHSFKSWGFRDLVKGYL